jgi:uncharacterized membrane protein YhhN
MSSGLAITWYLAAGLVTAVLGTAIAGVKRRAVFFWTVACFLVPPLFFVLLVLPKRQIAYETKSPPEESFEADNLDRL